MQIRMGGSTAKEGAGAYGEKHITAMGTKGVQDQRCVQPPETQPRPGGQITLGPESEKSFGTDTALSSITFDGCLQIRFKKRLRTYPANAGAATPPARGGRALPQPVTGTARVCVSNTHSTDRGRELRVTFGEQQNTVLYIVCVAV